MDIGMSFVTDAQAAELMQPGDVAFDDPTMTAQALLGFDAAAGEARPDTAAA